MDNQRSRFGLYLGITSYILVLAFGLFLGRTWKVKEQVVDDTGQVEISKVLNLYSKSHSGEADFSQFWNIWDLLKEKYVSQPISEKDLYYGAIRGLVSGLNDPYSVYFPPKEAEEFAKDLSGEFEGIGAEIGLRDGQLIVVAPLKGSPAEIAGLRPGDKIFAIDGEETINLGVDEAVKKIRGPKDTSVKLTISHVGAETFEDISIVRNVITVPSVEWSMKENNIVYLRISFFNQDTWQEFDKAVKEFTAQSPKGLVLDMRSNPGGYLDSAVAITSEWVKEGTIVSEKFNNQEENKYPTEGKHRLAGIKTIVLVDEGTASGSEILAGALQDYGLATVVGKKTFGKGSVQDFQALPDGSAIKITVAKWFTPNGRQIDETGIMPDIIIEEMFTDVGNDEKTGELKYTDKGLEKAIELLKT
ncbi:MAG: S41 family peptidase [Candidatus Magasanikiibacteriota bacterium]